ncbi:hypothetical protein VTO42DRAFT_392 [Malbranchea cinnamomea]
MLQLSAARMNVSRPPKNSRSRTGTPDRGGIRKRGAATRIDRDGDLDMGGAGGGMNIGRSGRLRVRGGRSIPTDGRRPGNAADRTVEALQKAVFSGASSQANIRQPRRGGMIVDDREELSQLSVRGWKSSKAASNPGGAIDSLIAFLEKKATPDPRSLAADQRLKISKSRVEGDALIISIRPEQVDWVLRINGFTFAGSPLTIEKYDKQNMEKNRTGGGVSQAALDTKARMTAFLGKRYFSENKLLDLSRLGTDPDLVEMGMFNSTSTESKFFPALMKICELSFDSSAKRREAVQSVSLAHNNLPNVTAVTTLAQTFPDIKNLDLSNNQFKDIGALVSWRWKFRDLEFLDLSGNPVCADSTFKETMLKWYPKLRILNNVPVRTMEEIAAKKKTPIPVRGPSFRDDSHIAENFLKAFFVGFDHDRDDLLNGIYDNNTIFSLSVNSSAPRAPQSSATSWDPYIKKSRNLLKVNHLNARMNRTFIGRESIRDAWKSFPKTKHPDLLTNPHEWLIECHPIPGLPDLSGQNSVGVGGLLIMVHGKFNELDQTTGSIVETRSFDRTFILGPGGGLGGLRVSNDMLCLRAFGDCQAWVPEDAQTVVPTLLPTVVAPPLPQQTHHPEARDGYGMAGPGKTDEQVRKEQLVLEISFRTKMTLQFSEMALTGNNWNLDAALKNFEELKAQGQLPPNAFLSGV